MKESYIEEVLVQTNYRRLLIEKLVTVFRAQKNLSEHGVEHDGILKHSSIPDFDSREQFSKSADRVNGVYANAVTGISIGVLVKEIKEVEVKLTKYDLEYIPFKIDQISSNYIDTLVSSLTIETVPWEKT